MADRSWGDRLLAPIRWLLRGPFYVWALLLFLLPTTLASCLVPPSVIYHRYVATVSNLTGLNTYLTNALAALLFIPFFIGFRLLSDYRQRNRYAGGAIMLVLVAMYNSGLYYATQDTYFSFNEGATLKWYAFTPEGVQEYDRPGVDPKYGITLQPVTPDIVRQLGLMKRGEFRPIDPRTATFFNPITGKAEVWYYRWDSGEIEFYDKPGFHPGTGTALTPVTRDIYAEWQESERKRLAAMGPPPTPTHAGPRRDPLEEKW